MQMALVATEWMLPCDQGQGKGSALSAFLLLFHTIQECNKEVSDHRGRSKTIFICRQKKKKFGGPTIKFNWFADPS